MAQQKSLWKKYEFFIIAAITLLFIYVIVFLNQKINFFLGNELIVYLTPNQKSFYMHYGDVGKAVFNVSIENVAYCKAQCFYSFNDRSTNKVIEKGDFEIEKGQFFTKNFDLSVKRLGSGQDIYSFDVKCHSIRSFLCLTESPDKLKSSLVIVNYDLTETEKELKKILKQNVTKLLELLYDTDISYQKINQKYFELSHKINLNNLSKEKISINDAYDKLSISVENLRSLWSVENYVKLNQLFNESFFDTLDSINKSLENLDNEINGIVELHNGLLSKLSVLNRNLNELNNFINILDDNETSNNFAININKFDEISSSIINNTFESYNDVVGEIDDITKQQKTIIEKSKIPATTLLFNSEYFLKHENDLLCSLKQDCKENISVESIAKKTEDFIKNYPDSAVLKQSCNSLGELNQNFLQIKNETSIIVANKSINFPADDKFLNLANEFLDNEARKINNSYYDSFEKIKSENKTSLSVIEIASSFLPKNKTNIKPIEYNQSINISLYLLSKIKPSEEISQLLSKCSKLEPRERIGTFDFGLISTDITYKIASKIDINLSDNPPICCVFNECKPCCRDDSCRNNPRTFPVILVHGHSVAKAYSPEFSLDAFDKLQSKLQGDGYLNAGVLLYSGREPLEKGEWGLSGKPVTVKVTYYYDVYRKEDTYTIVPTKSESTDTYALRLNDIVNVVKERTGKPKVNIISFSMGGLVARKYIQIFGGDSVDKLITIATPHKGIIGEVAGLCPVLGEGKECIDMQQNSLFLNKLNDPSKQPSNVKIYNIIGTGCLRAGEDGDGVVLAEKASLKGIVEAKEFLVNGTCSGTLGYFHTDLLDIDKYPQTYRIVTEVLKE